MCIKSRKLREDEIDLADIFYNEYCISGKCSASFYCTKTNEHILKCISLYNNKDDLILQKKYNYSNSTKDKNIGQGLKRKYNKFLKQKKEEKKEEKKKRTIFKL